MKNRTRKILALALSFLLALSVAACGSESADNAIGESSPADTESQQAAGDAGETVNTEKIINTTEDGKTIIKVAWPATLTSLAPFQASSPAKMSFSNEVLEALGTYDYDYNFCNVIAKEWKQIDEEGYKFSIEIYDYVHDSEGNSITADDVLFSIDKCKESGAASTVFGDFVGATKIGDYTIEVELSNNSYGYIQQFLSSVFIVSQKAFEESSDEMATNVVGTGPYKVTEFVNGSSLTTEAVEDYWQTDEALRGPSAKQNVDVIQKVFISENSQREIALETGEVDFAYNMSGSSVTQLENNKNITYNAEPGHHVYTFIPSSAGVLADERLRQAVFYALDIDSIIASSFDGFAFPSNYGLAFTSDYNSEWDDEDYYDYNPEKAKELIQEAGAEGTHLRLIAVATNPMAELVQAYLNAVGFDVEVDILELATYLTDAYNPEAYDLCTITYTSPTTIQTYKIMLDEANYGGTTMNGFVDDELQNLLDIADNINGHSPESMENLHDYVVDKAYFYTPIRTCEVSMWRTDSAIVDISYGCDLAPLFGSFNYVWN